MELITSLTGRYNTWQIFEDFLALSAISISNAIDRGQSEKREAVYFDIIKKYKKDEINLFPEMLAHLVNELESHVERPTDILGEVFHELELHNKYNGQFFTPQHVCDMMGKITVAENDKIIEKNGFLTVCEPCCGSGAMILGFAGAMQDCKYNFQKQMVATAIDIDLKCVHMTYLQLSLYGIPAVVIHGDSMAMEEWSRWYTPFYILNGWQWRQGLHPGDAEPMTTETDTTADVAVSNCPETFDINLNENESGQLQLGL